MQRLEKELWLGIPLTPRCLHGLIADTTVFTKVAVVCPATPTNMTGTKYEGSMLCEVSIVRPVNTAVNIVPRPDLNLPGRTIMYWWVSAYEHTV